MIEAADSIQLPAGVVLRGDALLDEVRGIELPLNTTGRAALETSATVSDMAAALAALGAQEPLRDAVAFATRLNTLLLLNVRAPLRQRLLRRARSLRYGLVPQATANRLDIGPPLSFVRALAPTALAVLLLLLPLAVIAGGWACAAALAAAVGVVVHEGAHAVALHGVRRALVLDGLKPSILHPPVGSLRMVAAAVAGPLAPAVSAVACTLAWHPAALACVPLAAHALGLTIAAPDGRNACGLS
jgi:hypothetical protein